MFSRCTSFGHCYGVQKSFHNVRLHYLETMTQEKNTASSQIKFIEDKIDDWDWDIKEEELIKFTRERNIKFETTPSEIPGNCMKEQWKKFPTETIEKIEKCVASITGSKLSELLIATKINRLAQEEIVLFRMLLTYELLYGTIVDPGTLKRGCLQSEYACYFAIKTRFDRAYYCQQHKHQQLCNKNGVNKGTSSKVLWPTLGKRTRIACKNSRTTSRIKKRRKTCLEKKNIQR